MSEEIEVTIDGIEQDIQEFTPSEQKARSQGWRPRGEWEGSDDEWIDFSEFNRRGELMSRIQEQSSIIHHQGEKQRQLEMAVQELGRHNKKLVSIEYEGILKELKQQRLEALEVDDHRQALEIEEQIEELKELDPKKIDEGIAPIPAREHTPAPPPEIIQWAATNSWYEKDPVMRAAAEVIAREYVYQNPHVRSNPIQVLNHITEKIKERFPKEFGLDKRTYGASKVSEGGSGERKGSSGSRSRFSVRDLSEVQRQVAKTLVDAGAFKNVQEYVDQVAKNKELESQLDK